MAYRKWQKKKIGLSIEELTKQSEGIVGVDNVNRTNLGRTRIENLKVYGTTLVNLLGSYGNFEVDSNSDGLADGWTNDATLTAVVNAMTTIKLFGLKSQKITLSADGEGGNYIEVNVVVGEVLFVAGHIRAGDTATTAKLIVDWRDATDTQISTNVVGTNATTVYARKAAVFTVPANAVKARIYITVAGITGKLAYFDGIQIHNLTSQGALDSVRSAKYGVANWADLTAAQLEANISYVDSVASTNVENGTASELTVKNRGKNLFDILVPISGSGQTAILEQISPTSWYISGQYHARIYLYPLMRDRLKPNTDYHLSFVVSEIIGSPKLYLVDASLTPQYIYFISAPGGVVSKTLTTNNEGKVSSCYVYDNLNQPWSCVISDIQLEEGSVATDYVSPRSDSITIPSTCELHGYNGVFNCIDSNGNFIKNWERANKTTDASGVFTLSGYFSGSKVICRNKDNGEVQVLNAAASVTTSWPSTDIEIVYRLAIAVSSSVAIRDALGDLHRGHNNFIYFTQTRESFTGDGYTTVFNTTIIPTSVKVNGLAQTSGVTLGASSVTFTTAPRRKSIIEVFGAGTGSVLPAINLEVLDASGTSEAVPALVDLSVTENEEKTGYLNVNGAPLKVAGNKTYTVTLNKDLIESQDNILEEYRDKKFRLKVENPRDSSTEYLGVCHIDPEASLNYLNGTESINIKCGDLYD